VVERAAKNVSEKSHRNQSAKERAEAGEARSSRDDDQRRTNRVSATERDSRVSGVDDRPTLGGTLFPQIISVQKVWGSEDETEALRLALDTAIAFKPRNPVEALLITQMAGVHAAAVSALYKAGLQGQPYEIAELHT
jgi:hypothetical protein